MAPSTQREAIRAQAAPRVQLEVTVLFTGIPSTLASLRTAAQLAQGLAARIRLLVVQTVPFPLDIDRPPIDLTFQGRRFNTLIQNYEHHTPCRPVETVVDILLCRDPAETLLARLAPGSVVVIGKRSRWWPKAEDWLARKLRQANHHVVRVSNHKETPHA